LHLAVLEGNISAIQNIIKKGSPLDTTDQFGFRPIHYACWHNQYWKPKENTRQIIDILLQAGVADSPSLAAFRGEQKALQSFIQQDPRLANDGDTLEKRPLSTAVEKDHKAMVRYLLDHGADPKLAEGRCCPHGSALNDRLDIKSTGSSQVVAGGGSRPQRLYRLLCHSHHPRPLR